jgi:hypothetical protein
MVIAGAGCTDARGRYDDYGDRLPDASTVQIDAPLVSEIPDVTGTFFMAARPPLGETVLLYFEGEFVYTAVTANTGTIHITVQPLDFETFEPVGDPITADPVDVGMDASYTWPLVGTIPARANPVTGTNIQIDANVYGTIIHENFVCGTLDGTAGALPLEGAVFGAQRVTGEEYPAEIHQCADAPPAP